VSQAKNKKGLGRGFDVLVPVGLDVQQVSAAPEERIHKLAIDIVKPKPDQPRKHFDEKALAELADSISEHGIMQPLVVVEVEQNMYAIIAGERRWRAAKKAGLTEVPVVVRTASDLQQVELALLENVQREDLSPLETANTIVKLHNEYGQDYDTIAKRLGKAPTTIANIVRLLTLPIEMQEALAAGAINEGHARALLSLAKLPNEQQVLFKQIVLHGWNVRQAESFAGAAKKAVAPVTSAAKGKPLSHAASDKTAQAVGEYLRAPVKVQHTAKGGKVVISFKNDEEFERITKKLLGK
jgi:ParB family transcriptional regulator, chromosome partitioning protein